MTGAPARTRKQGGDLLSLRALNRATLARQMLLEREKATVLRAIERLVGLQAQLARPPFLGLWTRLRSFEREQLLKLLRARQVVRATLMRCTLHLMTARDYLRLWPALEPALQHGARSVLRARMDGIPLREVLAEGRARFRARPQSFETVRKHLEARFPGADVRALGYVVRTHLPLVMAATDAPWGYPGAADFTLAESWLEAQPEGSGAATELAQRYLAAFGPATATDLQTWSGLPAPDCRLAMEALRSSLVVLRDERGRELFDLPRAPRPPAETPAPVRFLPEFDNLILSHADRRRFLADEHRRFVFRPGLQVLPTFLVDGFVAGTWSVERRRSVATLVARPFEKLRRDAREALALEGEAVARFVEPEAGGVQVRFES